MTKTRRPNRDALSNALDIYRDAMRPFIVRYMKRVRGKRVSDAISDSLNDRQAEQFRRRGKSEQSRHGPRRAVE